MSTVLTSQNFSSVVPNNINYMAGLSAYTGKKYVYVQFFNAPQSDIIFNNLQLYTRYYYQHYYTGTLRIRIFSINKYSPNLYDLYNEPWGSTVLKSNILLNTNSEVSLIGDTGDISAVSLNLSQSFSLKTFPFSSSVTIPSNKVNYAIEISLSSGGYIEFGLQTYSPASSANITDASAWSTMSPYGLIFSMQNIPVYTTSFVGNKLFITSNVDPRVSTIQVNGQGLPNGSVVRWTSTNQKFYKVSGGDLSYNPIVITVPSEWGWSQQGKNAWDVLQSF